MSGERQIPESVYKDFYADRGLSGLGRKPEDAEAEWLELDDAMRNLYPQDSWNMEPDQWEEFKRMIQDETSE